MKRQTLIVSLLWFYSPFLPLCSHIMEPTFHMTMGSP